MNDHVQHRERGEHRRARQLAKPALEAISIDRRATVLRHDKADTWMVQMQKGSAHPNVEMFGAKALPFSRNLAKLGATRDAVTARKRRGRTRLLMRDRYTRSCLCACVLARQLHRQPLPALLAPPSEHLTAPLVGHAKAESVGLDTALVARAVGWLAHFSCLR